MLIKTQYIYPPIPDRTHDWLAHYDGEEERGQNGFGRTEAEAIADLKKSYPRCETCGEEEIDANVEAFELSGKCVCDDCADEIFEANSQFGNERAKLPLVTGIGLDKDNCKALIIYLIRPATDEEIRLIHDAAREATLL